MDSKSPGSHLQDKDVMNIFQPTVKMKRLGKPRNVAAKLKNKQNPKATIVAKNESRKETKHVEQQPEKGAEGPVGTKSKPVSTRQPVKGKLSLAKQGEHTSSDKLDNNMKTVLKSVGKGVDHIPINSYTEKSQPAQTVCTEITQPAQTVSGIDAMPKLQKELPYGSKRGGVRRVPANKKKPGPAKPPLLEEEDCISDVKIEKMEVQKGAEDETTEDQHVEGANKVQDDKDQSHGGGNQDLQIMSHETGAPEKTGDLASQAAEMLPWVIPNDVPYVNPDIDPEVHDRIKTYWVYRHKSKGLFTYNRGRVRPPMEEIRKMYQQSYLPHVLVSRLKPSPATGGATPLPKLLRIESKEKEERRRQRKFDLDKVIEVKSPSIYALSPKLPKLLLHTDCRKRKRSVSTEKGEPTAKRALLPDTGPTLVAVSSDEEEEELEPQLEDSISKKLEELITADVVSDDSRDEEEGEVIWLSSSKKTLREAPKSNDVGLCEAKKEIEDEESLKNEEGAQPVLQPDLPHMEMAAKVKGELETPPASPLTPEEDVQDGAQLGIQELGVLPEQVEKLSKSPVQSTPDILSSVDLTHTGEFTAVCNDAELGVDTLEKVDTPVKVKKKRGRKKKIPQETATEPPPLVPSPPPAVGADITNEPVAKARPKRQRKPRTPKQKPTEEVKKEPVKGRRRGRKPASQRTVDGLPSSPPPNSLTGGGTTSDSVSPTAGEGNKRTRKPTKRLLESIESDWHFKVQLVEDTIAKVARAASPEPVTPATAQEPGVKKRGRRRKNTSLLGVDYLETSSPVVVKSEPLAPASETEGVPSTGPTREVQWASPVKGMPTAVRGTSDEQEFAEHQVKLKGLVEQGEKAETERIKLNAKAREKEKHINQLEKELNSKLRNIQGGASKDNTQPLEEEPVSTPSKGRKRARGSKPKKDKVLPPQQAATPVASKEEVAKQGDPKPPVVPQQQIVLIPVGQLGQMGAQLGPQLMHQNFMLVRHVGPGMPQQIVAQIPQPGTVVPQMPMSSVPPPTSSSSNAQVTALHHHPVGVNPTGPVFAVPQGFLQGGQMPSVGFLPHGMALPPGMVALPQGMALQPGMVQVAARPNPTPQQPAHPPAVSQTSTTSTATEGPLALTTAKQHLAPSTSAGPSRSPLAGGVQPSPAQSPAALSRPSTAGPGYPSPTPSPAPRAHSRKSSLKVIMDKPLPAHSKPANYSMYSQLKCSVEKPHVRQEVTGGLDLSRNKPEAVERPGTARYTGPSPAASAQPSTSQAAYAAYANNSVPAAKQTKPSQTARKSTHAQQHQQTAGQVGADDSVASNMYQGPAEGSSMMVQQRCETCGKTSMFICSGCRSVAYCSVDCQAAAWDIHCRVCSA